MGHGISLAGRRNAPRVVEQHRLLDLLGLNLDTVDLRPQRRHILMMQFHLAAHATQRTNDVVVPRRNTVRRPFEVLSRKNYSATTKPGTEQQEVDVESEFVLQPETLPGDARLAVYREREPPKIVLVLMKAGLRIACILSGGHECSACSRLFGRARSPVHRRTLPVSISKRSRTRASV